MSAFDIEMVRKLQNQNKLFRELLQRVAKISDPDNMDAREDTTDAIVDIRPLIISALNDAEKK